MLLSTLRSGRRIARRGRVEVRYRQLPVDPRGRRSGRSHAHHGTLTWALLLLPAVTAGASSWIADYRLGYAAAQGMDAVAVIAPPLDG